jgi:hypothetical protein
MEIVVKNAKELKEVQKKFKNSFIFIPSGPGGVEYPVTVTIN